MHVTNCNSGSTCPDLELYTSMSAKRMRMSDNHYSDSSESSFDNCQQTQLDSEGAGLEDGYPSAIAPFHSKPSEHEDSVVDEEPEVVAR